MVAQLGLGVLFDVYAFLGLVLVVDIVRVLGTRSNVVNLGFNLVEPVLVLPL